MTWAAGGPGAQHAGDVCRTATNEPSSHDCHLDGSSELHIPTVTAAAAEEGTAKGEQGEENPEMFFC